GVVDPSDTILTSGRSSTFAPGTLQASSVATAVSRTGSTASGGRILALSNLDIIYVDPIITANSRVPNAPRKTGIAQTANLIGPQNLTVSPSSNAQSLSDALTAGGGAGVTVTGSTLSGNSDLLGGVSSGLYTLDSVPDTYGLTRDGIVLSTGDVTDYNSGSNTSISNTTSFGTPATAAQELLLDPITGGGFDHFDVTQLDINFDMQPGFDTLFFEVVFGSDEFPEFVGSTFIDGFGLFLNGTNVASVNGLPVNINHPSFQAIPGTELDGILAPNGDARLLFQVFVGDGALDNTLSIIIADTSDSAFDTTVYLASLGGTDPDQPTTPLPPPTPTNFQGDTLVGSSGNDIIRGADGDDLLLGGSGNDSLNGGNGDDVLFGGADDDLLEGRGGNDELKGQGGQDSIDGGDDDDLVLWRGSIDGDDSINGGTGNDELEVRGDGAQDRFTISQSPFINDPTMTSELLITEGNSTLTVINTRSGVSNTGEPLNTVETIRVNGNNGNDRVFVTDLNRVPGTFININGGAGNDRVDMADADVGEVLILVDGGVGRDTLFGSDNAETLFGGEGDDVLTGGGGDDSLDGGAGQDSMLGGDGNDTLIGDLGNDTLFGDAGDDSMVGGDAIDSLDGGDGNDTMEGNAGDDRLIGRAGDDSMNAGNGNDSMFGGEGDDRMEGGFDDDRMQGQGGNDTMLGGHGHDRMNGGIGNDILNGEDGNDTLEGGDGDDGLTGMDGDDLIVGGMGDDTMVGGDGDDSLRGGSGQDIGLGGDGDDGIIGGGGSNDTLAGGEGNDFIATDAAGANNDNAQIDEDFTLSQDDLDRLSGAIRIT
ncbi:MAG: hypothetical protein CMJ78_07250, partial [Planctomycetaceae bacterium]|nr:hypothetical protein [Planctomycetaceae bacterium]